MSRISVRNTLGDIFSTYSKNFFTLAPLGITLGIFAAFSQNFQTIINYYFLNTQNIPAADTIVQEAASTGSTIGNIAYQIKQQSVFLQNTHNVSYAFMSVITYFLLFVIYYYVYFSFFKILINLQKNQHPNLKTLFMYDRSIFKAIAAFLLIMFFIAGIAGLSIGMLSGVYFLLQSFFNIGSLAVSYKIMIPIIALLVCTIFIGIFYVLLRVNFIGLIILDKNMNIKDAFKTSWHLTKGSTFKISIIYSLNLFISLAIFLALITLFSMVFKLSFVSSIAFILYTLIGGISINLLIPLAFVKTYQKLLQNN